MAFTEADAGGAGWSAPGGPAGGPRSVRGGRAALAWRMAAGLLGALGLLVGVGSGSAAWGQTLNPVYVDDSTRTRDALAGLDALLEAGNVAEAVRTVQDLLDTEGHRVVESSEDADLFVDVRARVIRFIASRALLLEAYREAQGAEAARLVGAGEAALVERTRWLTRAGLEASLRLAQSQIEAGGFEAARLLLVSAEGHPDASDAELAGAGASLAGLVARYLPREDVRALASRWAGRAGRSVEQGAPVAWPEVVRTPAHSPVTPQPGVDLLSLDRRAQATVRLAPDSARPALPDERDPRMGTAQLPWVMPTVVGETVLVNDGEYLSAWDRFTLAMRWRLRPPVPESMEESIQYISAINSRQLLSQGLEDGTFITPAGGIALAATGLARMGVREGDDRLHAVEIQTGRLLWSTDVDGLDPALAGSSIRGPALVDGQIAVVTVRMYQQFRRLQAVSMVGLDVHTGEARWVRPLASAGTLPYRRPTAVADLGIVHEGVVYRADELGVIAALEAATGRVVWIRRMLSYSGPDATGEPWAMSAPIVDGGSLVVLSPDHRDVLRLDLATGEVIGQRGADVLQWPRYLLRAGEWLVAVGVQRMFVTRLDSFETAEVLPTPALPPPVIGRVIVAGDRVVAPTGAGLVVVDPALPGRGFDEQNTIASVQRGMLLAAESQLLLADNDRLRSFLVWPEALERLRARVDARPGDPAPALTLARLAARAGQWDLMVPSLDRCLEVLDGLADGGGAVRDDLFRLGLSLVRESRRDTPDPESPAAPAGVARALVERLLRAARTPEQQVAALVELGTLQERAGEALDACATYQRILDQPALGGALWSEGVLSVRAGLEASRRVRGLVAAQGPSIYEPFETSSLLELRALGASPRAADLALLAQRYPAARGTARFWLDLARAQRGQGQEVEAIDALRLGLESASALALAGVPEGRDLLPEAVGALVSALDDLGEPAWALRTLEEALLEAPDLRPVVDGGLAGRVAGVVGAPGAEGDAGPAVDVVWAIRRVLAERAGQLAGRAVIGGVIEGEPRVVSERRVASPLLGDPAVDAVVLVGDGSRRLEFWRVADGVLAMAWEKQVAGDDLPVVVSVGEARLLLATRGRGGASVECLSAADGSLLWRTPGFESLFEPDPDLQARFEAARVDGATIRTPLDGMVRADDVLVAHDRRTLVLGDRSGRVAAFDMGDGRALWSRRLDVSQVHDMAVRGPRLAVGGAFPHPVGPDSVQTTLGPALLCLESRTGRTVSRHDDASAPDDDLALGEVRWVRIAPSGTTLAGLRLSVGAFDASSGLDRWRAEGAATSNTLDAWIDEDRLWVLGADRGLRLVGLGDGQLRVGALPTQGRTGSRARIALTRLPGSVALTSGRGVVLLDLEGGLLGVDAIDRQDTLLPPAVGESHVALLDAAPRRGRPEPTHRLSLVNTISAREVLAVDLLLPAEPLGVTLVAGHVLVSTRAGVVVLRTPVEP